MKLQRIEVGRIFVKSIFWSSLSIGIWANSRKCVHTTITLSFLKSCKHSLCNFFSSLKIGFYRSYSVCSIIMKFPMPRNHRKQKFYVWVDEIILFGQRGDEIFGSKTARELFWSQKSRPPFAQKVWFRRLKHKIFVFCDFGALETS